MYTRVILVPRDLLVILDKLVIKVIKDPMDLLVSLVTEVQLVMMVGMDSPVVMD